MLQWRPKAQEYMNEMMRHDSFHNNSNRRQPNCTDCGIDFTFPDGPDNSLPENSLLSQRMTRCRDCFHSPLLCGVCCLRHHERLPLHVIQVLYNILFFSMSRV